MKKVRPPEVKAGIWLDQENAFITLIIGKEEPRLIKIKSEVESRVRIRGEGKVFARFGNAFISDEEKKQHRQQNQRKKYFKQIINPIIAADYVYLFGPGRAKSGLQNAIEKIKGFKGKISAVLPADKMVAREAEAVTTDYFNSVAFKSFKMQLRYIKKQMGVT